MPFAPPAITIDIEDWRQSAWDRSLDISRRAADNVKYVLDLLARLDVHATLFVLGKFAAAFPEIVRDMAAAGHEIGCHGTGHIFIYHQTPDEFRSDVHTAKDRIEQILGQPALVYRAPYFSVVAESLWALDILAELGFEYDSSIFPVDRPRYGIPQWTRRPAVITLSGGREITEYPIATYPCCGHNWPIGGGGYHRLLPGPLARSLARRTMRDTPFVFYCHPYEFDPGEFTALPFSVPLKTRLHQGLGRGRFEARFIKFVKTFGGRRLIDLHRSERWERFALTDML